MSDGRETSGMEDKAVSTVDDLGDGNEGYFGEGTHWNAVTIHKLLTVLINNKIMAMRTMNTCENIPSDKSDSTEYSKEKEPPDKRSRHQYSPRHQQRHHHRHCTRHSSHHDERSSSISKVQKWSEDLDIESPEDDAPKRKRSKQPKEGYLVVDIESGTTKSEQPSKRRKRKKRKKSIKKKKSVQIDPEDLPTRARWTIIITSGLLILTCMFLVGVTLRMAPVIDEMVRSKNEELMNSLNRNNDPAYYSSFNTPPN